MESLSSLQDSLNIAIKIRQKERIDKLCKDYKKRRLLPKELEDEYIRLDSIFMEFYSSCIEYLYLTDIGWDFAIDLMRKHNLSPVDAIHLATALTAKYEVFVSSDADLIRVSKNHIESVTPGDAIEFTK